MTISIRRMAMAVALSVLLVPTALSAQAVAPGDRVRVRLVEQPRAIEGAAHRQLLRGTLVRITPDSLLLQLHPASDTTSIARVGIDRLDLSRGVRTRLESAAVNAAGFAFAGSIKRVLTATLDRDRYSDETTWESALIGAAGGAIIGVAVGALWPQEKWRRVRNW